jgi:hypothetical protein
VASTPALAGTGLELNAKAAIKIEIEIGLFISLAPNGESAIVSYFTKIAQAF